ncbi:MAG TPA: YdeI/OmpD-associated family protein [Streptosporangiaceae bacterium]|jgi:uncharacterized protein YdeI (YjbR/CyaY-like superfamily)
MPRDELAVVALDSQQSWRAWLDENHATSRGVWLKIAKKDAPASTVSYAEALDEAICYGWIDGQKGRLDDAYWLQRFTPRKPGSKWSKINREKAERLIAKAKVMPAGLREVTAAQADGRWAAAYEGQATATVPPDLAEELDRNPVARDFFATLTGANRYAILYRIQDAKKPETRARRIEKFVAMLNEHQTIHP